MNLTSNNPLESKLAPSILSIFHRSPALADLLQTIYAGEKNFWVVGGAIRDLLLERDITDLDLVCHSDPTPLARKWSRKLSAHWFWLDQDRRQSRIILKDATQIDFAPLRAETIEADLCLRDFTINAMALPLGVQYESVELVDPCQGQKDLQRGMVKAVSPANLMDDPLRMIKGIRHAVTLNFACAPGLINNIRAHAELLKRVAGERIREELLRILTSNQAIRGLDLLVTSHLLESLLGPFVRDFDWSTSMIELEQLSHCLISCVEQEEAGQKAEFGKTDRALCLLAAFIRYYRPHDLPRLLEKTLRFSRYEQKLIKHLTTIKPDLGDFLSTLPDPENPRQLALRVETLEPFALHQLILFGVGKNLLSRDQAFSLYRTLKKEQRYGTVPALLDGQQIGELLELRPGRQIAHWIAQMKQAEIAGLISSAEEAKEWLKRQISD